MAYVDPLVSEGVRHYLEASYRLLTGSAEGRRFLHLAAPIPGLAVHGYTTADDMDALVRSLDPGDGRGGSAVSGPTAAGARLDYGPGVDILRRLTGSNAGATNTTWSGPLRTEKSSSLSTNVPGPA